MKYGARNKITAIVSSVKKGVEMASVLITESLEDLDLKPGDTVQLISKAIHVLTVK